MWIGCLRLKTSWTSVWNWLKMTQIWSFVTFYWIDLEKNCFRSCFTRWINFLDHINLVCLSKNSRDFKEKPRHTYQMTCDIRFKGNDINLTLTCHYFWWSHRMEKRFGGQECVANELFTGFVALLAPWLLLRCEWTFKLWPYSNSWCHLLFDC